MSGINFNMPTVARRRYDLSNIRKFCSDNSVCAALTQTANLMSIVIRLRPRNSAANTDSNALHGRGHYGVMQSNGLSGLCFIFHESDENIL